MYFAEIAAMPAILFLPKIKVATRKTAIYSTKSVVNAKISGLQSRFTLTLD